MSIYTTLTLCDVITTTRYHRTTHVRVFKFWRAHTDRRRHRILFLTRLDDLLMFSSLPYNLQTCWLLNKYTSEEDAFHPFLLRLGSCGCSECCSIHWNLSGICQGACQKLWRHVDVGSHRSSNLLVCGRSCWTKDKVSEVLGTAFPS